MRQIEYKNRIFYIFDDTYLPSDDTFLLLDNLEVNRGDFVLDLGTGCGILGIIAAKNANKVILTDISPIAVNCAKKNVELNKLTDMIEIRTGNLFDPIRNDEKYDLILFNPPYLPISGNNKQNEWLERAWDGGETGREIIDKFLIQFNNYLKRKGRVQMIQTSLSDYEKTIDFLKARDFSVKIKARKKFFFEELVLLTVQK